MLFQFCFVLFMLISSPSGIINAEKNVTTGPVVKGANIMTTIRVEKLDSTAMANTDFTTPSILSTSGFSPPSVGNYSEQPHPVSKSKFPASKAKFHNSSDIPSTFNESKLPKAIVTEGGNHVSTVETSVSNFQDTRGISRKTIVTEGGIQEVNNDGVLTKTESTNVLPNPGRNFQEPDMEGISSMTEGKIVARKGVLDPTMAGQWFPNNNIRSNNYESKISSTPKNLVNKNSSLSTSADHVRNPKPMVTDDDSDSFTDRIQKMDYVIPIVCTIFSVPLLIVLAIYLYKRGSDLWERRHYNRMDFLIEGIYNQ